MACSSRGIYPTHAHMRAYLTTRRYKCFRTRIASGGIVAEQAGGRRKSAPDADNALATELLLEKGRNARLRALIPPWNTEEAARVSTLSIAMT